MLNATEVLLDNQGGRSSFQSEDLLHDVSALRRPYSLSGIDGASSEGLLVNREGMFRHFSRLGRSIGCSTMATANVLSMGDCIDKGYKVQYGGVADEFTVDADRTSYVFKRKLFTTGLMSKHYIADMVDYTIDNSVFVQTVAENLTTYSKRDIDDAHKAPEFQESVLGHFSTTDVVNIINSGVQHCSITAHIIYGPSIASIYGSP
jgi:hypothetical protein